MFQLIKFIDLVVIAPLLVGLILVKGLKLLRISRVHVIQFYYGLFIYTCIHTLLMLLVFLRLNL